MKVEGLRAVDASTRILPGLAFLPHRQAGHLLERNPEINFKWRKGYARAGGSQCLVVLLERARMRRLRERRG